MLCSFRFSNPRTKTLHRILRLGFRTFGLALLSLGVLLGEGRCFGVLSNTATTKRAESVADLGSSSVPYLMEWGVLFRSGECVHGGHRFTVRIRSLNECSQ